MHYVKLIYPYTASLLSHVNQNEPWKTHNIEIYSDLTWKRMLRHGFLYTK